MQTIRTQSTSPMQIEQTGQKLWCVQVHEASTAASDDWFAVVEANSHAEAVEVALVAWNAHWAEVLGEDHTPVANAAEWDALDDQDVCVWEQAVVRKAR